MEMKDERRRNREKHEAYSSFYSIMSFVGAFLYLVVDIVSKSELVSAVTAFVLLIVSSFFCEGMIRKLRMGVESNDRKMIQWKEKLIDKAQKVGYLSYLLLVATLFWAIIRFSL